MPNAGEYSLDLKDPLSLISLSIIWINLIDQDAC